MGGIPCLLCSLKELFAADKSFRKSENFRLHLWKAKTMEIYSALRCYKYTSYEPWKKVLSLRIISRTALAFHPSPRTMMSHQYRLKLHASDSLEPLKIGRLLSFQPAYVLRASVCCGTWYRRWAARLSGRTDKTISKALMA